jgi:hypothetical protein
MILCSSVPRSKEGRGGCPCRVPIALEVPSKQNTKNHNNAFNTNNEINTNKLNNRKIMQIMNANHIMTNDRNTHRINVPNQL